MASRLMGGMFVAVLQNYALGRARISKSACVLFCMYLRKRTFCNVSGIVGKAVRPDSERLARTAYTVEYLGYHRLVRL